jgi:thiol:disulfide interchange protein DsbA
MKRLKAINIIFVSFLISIFLIGNLPEAQAAADPKDPFPSFGSGPIEVRLYSDYFCPPCRATEPEIAPILQDLVKRNKIKLKMIDVPFNRNTPLYAKYYLYGIHGKHNLADAFAVKNILNGAAIKQLESAAQLENLFRSKGIKYSTYDAGPVLNIYNSLLSEDRIDTTPTVVIYRNGKKEKYSEKENVINALKRLQAK